MFALLCGRDVMVEGYQDSNEFLEDAEEIRGTVKWFNTVKGFGFMTPADGTGDVFVHLSALRAAGHESVDEGTTLVCKVVQGPKGLQAVQETAEQTEQAARQATSNGNGSFPIRNYDDLSVNEASQRLSGLTNEQLQQVRSYEKQNKNRNSLVDEIDRKIKSA